MGPMSYGLVQRRPRVLAGEPPPAGSLRHPVRFFAFSSQSASFLVLGGLGLVDGLVDGFNALAATADLDVPGPTVERSRRVVRPFVDRHQVQSAMARRTAPVGVA